MSKCRGCEVDEGQFHGLGCEYEYCPFCNAQLMSCNCVYEKLGLIEPEKYASSTVHMPPEVYAEGLNDDQEEMWEEILEAKGRVPFIEYPNVCAKCGTLYPKLFMVPNLEWEKYVQFSMRRTILCLDCFTYIKHSIDSHANDV